MNLMAEWETGSGMTEGSTWALENVDKDMGVHITRGEGKKGAEPTTQVGMALRSYPRNSKEEVMHGCCDFFLLGSLLLPGGAG
jgi:hypothetical protein